MTKPEAAKLVSVIIASCPGQASRLDRERVAAMIDTYALLLEDIEYEHASAALRVLLQTRTWMPSVADIRATVLELNRGPVKPGGEAWGSVLAAMHAQGAYRTPGTDFVFYDPVTARCVQALGWQELCLSENTTADRARFIELYDQLSSQAQRELQSPALAAARRARELETPDIVKQLAARFTPGKPDDQS